MKKLKNIKISEILGVLIFIVLFIPAFIRRKISRNKIWLVSEFKTARDNGFVFFEYMRKHHPEIKCYYAIDKKCEDYEKVKKYGNNVINWGGLKHYFLYMTSNCNLSSHKNGNPNHLLFSLLQVKLNLYNKFVFLQHGITKDNIPNFYYKNAKFKLFICGAKREFDYINEVYGYPKKNVVYTGFARFDNLHDKKPNKKLILFMPTWRRWIQNESEFLKSNYYKNLQELLNNEELNSVLEKNDINLIFCPHLSAKKYVHNYKTTSSRISIVDSSKMNIQKLLIDSSLLITDFSSVYMDFAYMKKPIIYYQFDLNEYRSKHLEEGYFNYKNDGFGDIIETANDAVKKIKYYIENDYSVENKYKLRTKDFFPLNDNKNCERIYEEVRRG